MPHAAALLMLLTILCDTRQPNKKEKTDYNEDTKFQKQEDKTYRIQKQYMYKRDQKIIVVVVVLILKSCPLF